MKKMHSNGTQLLIGSHEWHRDLDFLFVTQINGRVSFAQPLTLVESPPEKEGYPRIPTFSLDQAAAQEMFDRLWELGFRPKDGAGNEVYMHAMKGHLEDMRKLVFDKEITVTKA